tara:strand:+ start:21665 stop:22243 length:579 start_codon:yes stop_codon:yes gene_type:complete
MKLLSPKSLINIFEYEKVRDDFRKEIILYKKSRRLSLGPNITVTFENERTLLFQIQEIMRAERIVKDEKIKEEIEIYNGLMPPKNGVSATLFIEITDEKRIKTVLNQFIGLTDNKTIFFDINGKKTYAKFEEGREEEDKISSVHYLRFLFSDDDKKSFNENGKIKLGISYKDYKYTEMLSDEMLTSLIEDIN